MMERISDMKLAGLIEKLDLKLTPRFEEGEFDHLHMALRELYMYRAAAPLEKVQEWAKAEREGLLAIFPCKPHEDIFIIDGEYAVGGLEAEFSDMSLDGHAIMEAEYDGFEIKSYRITQENKNKTWFLTREEAQAALDGREGQG